MPSSTSSSERRLARPFDDDVVTRPVPEKPWRGLVIIAILITCGLTLGWEAYWRANWFIPGDYKNSIGLWADQRRAVQADSTVIIGSSRVLFGLDLDVWESQSGVRPIQLALEGTSPTPVLADLAADESFRGRVVIGATSGLIFSGGNYRAEVIENYKAQTPSERVDHFLSNQLEKHLAFLDDQTKPSNMLIFAPFPLRKGQERFIDVRKIEIMDIDRNAEMWSRVVEDPAYAQFTKDAWAFGMDERIAELNDPSSGEREKSDTRMAEQIDLIAGYVKAIQSRGGEAIFVRMPYEGKYIEMEQTAYPREKGWDRLLEVTGAPGVHFADYDALQGYLLPEWSHLDAREAERFTAALYPIVEAQIDAWRAGREPE